jgi:hypothetical protein
MESKSSKRQFMTNNSLSDILESYRDASQNERAHWGMKRYGK